MARRQHFHSLNCTLKNVNLNLTASLLGSLKAMIDPIGPIDRSSDTDSIFQLVYFKFVSGDCVLSSIL